MNIVELIKTALLSFPEISDVVNDIHIDFNEDVATSYGLSPVGDRLVKTSIIGKETRQHTFQLYALYQSINDYDRLSNSGILLRLQYYLEHYANEQEVTITFGDRTMTGILKKITCANGMVFAVPNDNMNDGVQYNLQIIAEYEVKE